MKLKNDITIQELIQINEWLDQMAENNKKTETLQARAREVLDIMDKYTSNTFWFIYSVFGAYRKARREVIDNLAQQDIYLDKSKELINKIRAFEVN